MKSLLLTLSLMLLLCNGAWAQEDDVASATSALQGVLSNLKQSVDKLTIDNDQLSARDNAMRQEVDNLKTQLGQLQAQGDQLYDTVDRLKGNNASRAQEIDRLQKEGYALDDQAQQAQAGIKMVQQSLDAGFKEDERLLLQLKAMGSVFQQPVKLPSAQEKADARRQKEKLKLMKMIYDSQQRQEALHQEIMDFQKNTPLKPAAAAMAHQEIIKEQIKDLQDEIATYPVENTSKTSGPSSQWDDTQLYQLEMELKSLEKNYAQLKDLMDQITKKAQSLKMSPDQHVEENKLQATIADLNHQSIALRVQLDDLRSQMVDLDKRKSRLETMVQHL